MQDRGIFIPLQEVGLNLQGKWNSVRESVTRYAMIRNGEAPFFSLNVAEWCPVGCDCYWKRDRAPQAIAYLEEQDKEVPNRLRENLAIGPREVRPIMTPDEMAAFVQKRVSEGAIAATFVGGEPYANVDALKAVTPLIKNWIVTSGTVPLRNFPSAHFVSVDGANAETHDKVRRMNGLFDRLTHNLTNARQQFDKFPAYIHFVANAINYQQLPAVLDHWSDSGLVNGVFVSTATSIGKDESWMQLTDEMREHVVENLLRLHGDYGSFLCSTKGMIEDLHPDKMKLQTPENCGTAIFSPSFDGWGNQIGQCILGPNADCSTCGCTITGMTHPLVEIQTKGIVGLQGLETVAMMAGVTRGSGSIPEADPTGQYPPAK